MSALDASLFDASSESDVASDSLAVAPAEGKYVYCIIRHQTPRDFGDIGIGGGARVYTVHHEDLAAVVSDTPIVIYDPTRENVLAHEFVNETVMREFTVINEDDSRWTSKVGVGGLVRTVKVLVHVDEWDGPDRVVGGGGSYLATRKGPRATGVALAVHFSGPLCDFREYGPTPGMPGPDDPTTILEA